MFVGGYLYALLIGELFGEIKRKEMQIMTSHKKIKSIPQPSSPI
jgi:hypothetical protein